MSQDQHKTWRSRTPTRLSTLCVDLDPLSGHRSPEVLWRRRLDGPWTASRCFSALISPRQPICSPSTPNRLRQAGLSWRKIGTLRDLAEMLLDGRLDVNTLSTLPDDDFIASFTALCGIGPWTARGALLIALQREDVVLLGDVALRKAVQRADALGQLPSQQEVLEIGENGGRTAVSQRLHCSRRRSTKPDWTQPGQPQRRRDDVRSWASRTHRVLRPAR